MHPGSLLRMEWFVKNYLNGSQTRTVLDVGSYDVNGSYRQFFPSPGFTYIGLDMAAGPNVDIVPVKPYVWTEVADDSQDVVISGQAFEHIEFFWFTMAEMARVLRPNGLLCLVLPRGFAVHRYPVDCYRFDADGMTALARYCQFEILHASCNMGPIDAEDGWYSGTQSDSFLVARKPMNWKGLVDPASYVFTLPDWANQTAGFVDPKTIGQTPEEIITDLRNQLVSVSQETESLRQETAKFQGALEHELQKRRVITQSVSYRMMSPFRKLNRFVQRHLLDRST